ncbi:MAG TPA: hypothetical protein VF765_34620 [Polyangiaceae bacterium]
MRRHFLAALLATSAVCATSLWPREAAAQQAAPAAGVGDEVRTKDGGVFRGTITERIPGDHVDLLMPTGQTRRFKMSDVSYAGAASHPESGAGPGPAVDAHVVADQPDVQLLVRVGQSEATGWSYHGAIALEGRQYAIVCTAPCDAQLPAGLQRLALSQHGGTAVEADDPVDLRGPSTLYTHYDSHAAIRTVGWVLGFGSGVGGIVIMVLSFDFSCTQQAEQAGQCNFVNTGQFIAGLAVAIVGGIVGGIMAGIGDHATIQLVPTMSSGPLRLPGASESLVGAAPETPGLGLRLRF